MNNDNNKTYYLLIQYNQNADSRLYESFEYEDSINEYLINSFLELKNSSIINKCSYTEKSMSHYYDSSLDNKILNDKNNNYNYENNNKDTNNNNNNYENESKTNEEIYNFENNLTLDDKSSSKQYSINYIIFSLEEILVFIYSLFDIVVLEFNSLLGKNSYGKTDICLKLMNYIDKFRF